MELLLAFSIVLLFAVLLSGLAHRTIVSTAVLFLVAGFVLGEGVTGVLPLQPDDDVVGTLAELALFSVLFTDGMRVGLRDLRGAWRLPGRALILGMPITFVITGALAHYVAGLPWAEALLVGAVLAPTDPVFASAIVGRPEVPARLRSLLNVESGVNDGLALPVVLVLIVVVSGGGGGEVTGAGLATELALGIALGVVVPLVAALMLRSRFTSTATTYEGLAAVSIGLIVLAAAELTHANLFLAAFSAGITIATVAPDLRESFELFGELVTELLKLAAILVFATLISPMFLGEIPVLGYVFAVLALVVARPVAIFVSLLGSGLPRWQQAAAAWFGPKGFASVVYGLLVLEGGGALADEMFHLIALVIVASILTHSSTDVPIAHAFARTATRDGEDMPEAPGTPGAPHPDVEGPGPPVRLSS